MGQVLYVDYGTIHESNIGSLNVKSMQMTKRRMQARLASLNFVMLMLPKAVKSDLLCTAIYKNQDALRRSSQVEDDLLDRCCFYQSPFGCISTFVYPSTLLSNLSYASTAESRPISWDTTNDGFAFPEMIRSRR